MKEETPDLSTAERITPAQIKEQERVRKLLPTEPDYKGKPGYWQKPAKVWRTGVGYVDGYEWGCTVTPNDGHGKLTREGSEMVESLKPFMKADTERVANLQAKPFEPRWRPSGARVERGFCDVGKPMLWRDSGMDDWEPLGVSCLGTPLRGASRVSRRGLQFDPGGEPWRYVEGSWQKL